MQRAEFEPLDRTEIGDEAIGLADRSDRYRLAIQADLEDRPQWRVGSGSSAGDAAASDTPLRAVFKINLNGQTVSIETVGQAYRFITNLSSVEWIEFRALHSDAVSALQRAGGNAMLTVQATDALRALFVRAKLL